MLQIAALAAALHAAPCYQSAECTATRLEAFILRRNPKAQRFAPLLARRVVMEAKRHGLRVEWMVAVMWIESDFRPGLRGRAHEVGLWQLRPFDHGLPRGWRYVRSMPGEFPLPRCKLPPGGRRREWRRLRRKVRECIIDDVAAGTYLAGLELASHRRMCRRLGHRVGAFRCSSPFLSKCPKWHGQEVDRLGHYNSGVSWPRGAYVSKLRRRSRRIRALLK
jgi:hypothetical protein